MSTAIFKKSVTNFYLLIFLIITSVLSVIIDLKNPNANYTRVVVNDFIINPIQYIVKTPANFFNRIFEEKETISVLQAKIEKLENDNKTMKLNLQKIDLLENEVSRLRSIKKEMRTRIKNIKIAKVTQRGVIPNKKSLQMNIGSKDNIKLGQTVMGTNGLVGQVVEVNMFSSKVLLITDANSNVPAIITRTGEQVIIKGRLQDSFLEISFLTNDANVKSGDLVVTSGQAGRYIPSINIGRIDKITKNVGERFATVRVETSEYVSNINEVIVTSDEQEEK